MARLSKMRPRIYIVFGDKFSVSENLFRGGLWISWKGGYMYKAVGACFADFNSGFLKYTLEM